MSIIVPGRPRKVHPMFARAVHDAISDAVLTCCPSMRVLAVPTSMIVRQAILHSRHRRRLESE